MKETDGEELWFSLHPLHSCLLFPSKVSHGFGLNEVWIATTTFFNDTVVLANVPAVGYAQVDT